MKKLILLLALLSPAVEQELILDPSVYYRVDEQYDNNHTNYNGGNPEASLWCGSQHMVWY
tara:strand:+ start:168 stop:347 length:180 start_codon:yes stop_codon:yes gene_type:complete